MKLNLPRNPLLVAVSLALCFVLSLATRPAEAQTLTTLHAFGGSGDGLYPSSGLIMDSSGNFYGTTPQGGAYGAGTVFELVNSSGSYSEKVLYSFTGSSDGGNPYAGLIMDASGNLYGTTVNGGTYGRGIVFELVNSSGSYSEIVLYTFSYLNGDGQYPYGGLIMDSSGNLYGTTDFGGANGYGAVFELVNSSGNYSEQVLYSFTRSNGDGTNPYAALAMDSSGNLYGTTQQGGTNNVGTVFELVNSSGTYTEQVLHSFTNSNGDGGYPYFAGVILDSSGNLYGTTSSGGANGAGIVFELVNSSGSYSEQVLHSFTGSDGSYPNGGLIRDSSGNLYGTTQNGGVSGYTGTVFELVNSSGSYSESVLWNFGGSCNGGAAFPAGGLVMDSAGNLYGATLNGGAHNGGVAFSLSHFSGPASPTTTAVTSSPNPVIAGNPVVFTATVTSSSGVVDTGTITFSEGSTILGTQPVACGSAQWVIGDAESLGIGTYAVTAQYTPSLPAFAPSSAAMSQTVNEAGVVLTTGNNTLNGNQTIDGSLSAFAFSGNGSGLSNVMASGLNCTSCIGNMQLGINYAGSSSQGGPAANALLLGGFPASAFQPAGSYATTGANLFTGNQSITGNLNVSGNSTTGGNSTTAGTVTIGAGGTPIVAHLSTTFTPTAFVWKSGSACTSQAFTLTGASDGDTIALGVPNERMSAPNLIYSGWVSAADTITLRVCAIGTKPSKFGTGAIRVDLWKH